MSVAEVFHKVNSCFIWQDDQTTHGVGERWNDFADEVRRGVVAKRDCEDFSLTCLIIGIEDYGWDPNECRVARVLTEFGIRSKAYNHAIAIYKGTILDNRQGGPVPIDWPSYRFYDWCGVPITDWSLYDTGHEFLKRKKW